MTEAEDPAFPNNLEQYDNFGNLTSVGATGLTKREYFAAIAIQGILANASGISNADHWIKIAIIYADALIAELEKKE
jgi:hypothetical protein